VYVGRLMILGVHMLWVHGLYTTTSSLVHFGGIRVCLNKGLKGMYMELESCS